MRRAVAQASASEDGGMRRVYGNPRPTSTRRDDRLLQRRCDLCCGEVHGDGLASAGFTAQHPHGGGRNTEHLSRKITKETCIGGAIDGRRVDPCFDRPIRLLRQPAARGVGNDADLEGGTARSIEDFGEGRDQASAKPYFRQTWMSEVGSRFSMRSRRSSTGLAALADACTRACASIGTFDEARIAAVPGMWRR
jgi:hypothetical protein